MAYTKVVFVDGVTPLNATNFNHIESGIEAVETEVTALDGRLDTLEAAAPSDLTGLTADVSQLKTESLNYDGRLDALELLNIGSNLTDILARLTTAEGTLVTVQSDLVGHTHANLTGDVTGAANLPSIP